MIRHHATDRQDRSHAAVRVRKRHCEVGFSLPNPILNYGSDIGRMPLSFCRP
jgi:hypothetical protein